MSPLALVERVISLKAIPVEACDIDLLSASKLEECGDEDVENSEEVLEDDVPPVKR